MPDLMKISPRNIKLQTKKWNCGKKAKIIILHSREKELSFLLLAPTVTQYVTFHEKLTKIYKIWEIQRIKIKK